MHLSSKQSAWTRLFAIAVLVWVVGWSLLLGKDLNWDFVNYHYYGPYLWLDQRLERDYFAGSFQSYLNPLSHLPHYLMIQAGWHSVLISVLLAAFHALNLWFIWHITRAVLPAHAQSSIALPALAVVLAMLAPLFVTTAGSSFADPSTSVFLLAGVWLLLRDDPPAATSLRRVALAGALFGLASGLKLTNAVLTLGLLVPVGAYWLVTRQPRVWARMAVLSGACLLAVLVAHGPWSWQLWNAFGNPFFPLFNTVFHSPDFPAITYRDTRFLGDGWRGLLTLPFEMMRPISWIYSENTSVDLRFAALLVLLAVTAVVVGARLLRRAPRPATAAADGIIPARLTLLTVMLLLAYVLWGMSTKIGRYALPLWLLLGPLLIGWALVLLARRDRVVALALTVTAAQAYALTLGGNPRWSPTTWDSKWLEVQVPGALQQTPVTLFTMGKLSYSAITPFLHRDTQVVNLVGQYNQPAGRDMTLRMRQLLATPAATMRVAFRDATPPTAYTGTLADHTRADIDAVLSLYGLGLAPDSCEPIVIKAPYLEGLLVTSTRPADDPDADKPRAKEDRLHVCKLMHIAPAAHAQALAEEAVVARSFNAIEAACGPRLSPHGTQTLRGGRGWMRTYFNSLHSLISDGTTVYVRPFQSMTDVDLGKLEDWAKSPSPACPALPASITHP